MAHPTPDAAPDWRDIREVSPRRSLILLALGAIMGLGVAGYALFTAKGTSTLVVPPEDVALVNQQPISRSDFVIQLQSLFSVDLAHSSPAERQKVLSDMIREELFVQRAKELDVAGIDPDVRAAMVNAVEQEIAADAITSQPSDDKLRAFYQANRSRYASEGTITVRDLVFPADRATEAATALKGGADADAVLERFGGHDSKRTRDTEFYFAAKIHLRDLAAVSPHPASRGMERTCSMSPRTSRPFPWTSPRRATRCWPTIAPMRSPGCASAMKPSSASGPIS